MPSWPRQLALLALTAVILASAALRLALYQGAYGWTELRFFVGGVHRLARALPRLRHRACSCRPHALAAPRPGDERVAVTLAVSAIGPQAFVMRQNVARVARPEPRRSRWLAGLDVDYGLTLGDDAVPDLVAALRVLPAARAAGPPGPAPPPARGSRPRPGDGRARCRGISSKAGARGARRPCPTGSARGPRSGTLSRVNVVFLSPHFPPGMYLYVQRLREAGATVLGIADVAYEALRPELRGVTHRVLPRRRPRTPSTS